MLHFPLCCFYVIFICIFLCLVLRNIIKSPLGEILDSKSIVCMYNLPLRKNTYCNDLHILLCILLKRKKKNPKVSCILLHPRLDSKGHLLSELSFCDWSLIFLNSKLSHVPFERVVMHRYPIPWWWWAHSLAFVILLTNINFLIMLSLSASPLSLFLGFVASYLTYSVSELQICNLFVGMTFVMLVDRYV